MLASPADAEPVASCEENGVLGPIVGTVGSLAALEALKVPCWIRIIIFLTLFGCWKQKRATMAYYKDTSETS